AARIQAGAAGARPRDDSGWRPTMKKYLTEFIGTFFLVLTIGLTVMGGSPIAPLAIGAALMVMVYMGGHVSGGHYNPAVSLAALLSRKLEPGQFLPYLAAQLLGAMAARAGVFWILGSWFAAEPAPTATAIQALLVEFLFTYALCLVVLNVATEKQPTGNAYYE